MWMGMGNSRISLCWIAQVSRCNIDDGEDPVSMTIFSANGGCKCICGVDTG